MMARNCEGRVPTPAEFSEADKAILAQADALPKSPVPRCETMRYTWCSPKFGRWSAKRTAISPRGAWVKRKSDPRRMQTILYVTAEVLRWSRSSRSRSCRLRWRNFSDFECARKRAKIRKAEIAQGLVAGSASTRAYADFSALCRAEERKVSSREV